MMDEEIKFLNQNGTEWVLNKIKNKETILYADAPIGSITPFGGTTAPDGFLLCQGQAVSRTTYAELFAVIGTSFGSGDGSTTFNIPDLREATTKGVGLSGKSSNHYDSDGVALGEFVEDRIKSHAHSMEHTHTFSGTTGAMNSNASHTHTTNGFESVNVTKSGFGYADFLNGTGTQTTNATNTDHKHNYSGTTSGASTSTTGRTGSATTEVKAVGVNYIIKATQVSVPADFAPVDAVEDGNMKAVTSNAVYDKISELETISSYTLPDSAYYSNFVDANLSNITIYTVGNIQICTGRVFMKERTTSTSADAIAFTLPDGYRPSEILYVNGGILQDKTSNSGVYVGFTIWNTGICLLTDINKPEQGTERILNKGYVFLNAIYPKA